MKKKDKFTYVDGTPVLTHQDRTRSFDFTPTELKTSPWKIWQRMNQFDCVAHLNKYCKDPKAPRTGTKSKVQQRLDDIWIALRHEQLLEEREADKIKAQNKEYVKWENYVHQIEQIRSTAIKAGMILIKNPEVGEGVLRSYKRTIGQIIGDMSMVNSGLVSLEAYRIYKNEPHNLESKTTFDHYYPRSRSSAMEIILHAKSFIERGERYTTRDVFSKIVTRCEVALLTKEENRGELDTKWQTEQLWEDAPTSYERASIIVVQVKPYSMPKRHAEMAEVLGIELPHPTIFPNAVTPEMADELLTQTLK